MLSRLALALCLSGASALLLPSAPARHAPVQLMASTNDRIEEMVQQNKVMLFMKGTKLFPQCGFSNTAVQILNAVTPNQAFETFDVLADNEIREGIKQYSNWPTIPQCYVDGEFIGGADLLIEMYQNGELQEMVEKAAAE